MPSMDFAPWVDDLAAKNRSTQQTPATPRTPEVQILPLVSLSQLLAGLGVTNQSECLLLALPYVAVLHAISYRHVAPD